MAQLATQNLPPAYRAKYILSHCLLESTQLLPCRIIEKNGEPYLYRYFLEQNRDGRQLWLHNIIKPDPEQLWHSHPWVAHSTIVSGGYTEQRLYQGPNKPFLMEYHHEKGGNNFITPMCIHRISDVQPNTWTTLTVTPNRADTWFFIDMDCNKTMMQTSPTDWWKTLTTRDGGKAHVETFY